MSAYKTIINSMGAVMSSANIVNDTNNRLKWLCPLDIVAVINRSIIYVRHYTSAATDILPVINVMVRGRFL